MNKALKRNLIIVLSIVFVLNIFVPVSGFSLNIKYGTFPDVADNHWAKQVITKMNLRNVVSGYEENGLRYFKPDQPVGQLEAVIMALRTMGLDDKENLVDTGRYLPFNVPDWAKAAALVGVDEGLIVGSQFTWNQEASRAWVAQLLVRIIDKEAEINSVSEEILPFTDSYAIPFQYLNYVKVANKYGLIKGDDQNAFLPNSSVTRAQMVAFLSRAEEYLELKASNVVIGKVTDINGSNVTLVSDGGSEYTLICNISTNMYGANGEIWVTDLRINDRVYAIVEGNTIKYLDLNPPQPNSNISTRTNIGTILLVYPTENTVVLKTKQDKVETISILPSTKIIREIDGSNLSIDKLVKNQEISLSLDSQGRAIKITVLSGITTTDSSQGVVYHFDQEQQLLTLKNANGLAAYSYNDDTLVSISYNRFAKFQDIKIGDSVKLEMTDEVVTKITLIATEVDLNSSGIVKIISQDNRIITYETPDKELKSHYLENSATIEFDGQIGAFSDIMVGDNIDVKIENSKITSLSVTNRKLHERSKGTVISTDYTNQMLTIRDSTGQLYVYELDSSAEILINDKKSYLHEIKKDMQVEMELSDSKITYVAARDTLLATVVRVNSKTKTIELALETGETKSFAVHSNFTIKMEDVSSPKLDHLDKGDVVEVRVENSKVTEIDVERIVTYKIAETFTNSSRVRVLNNNQTSRSLYLDSSVKLEISGKTNARVSDLKVNDIIKATFLGYKLQKVEIAPIVIGTVNQVNLATSVIMVATYDGRTFTYQFGPKDKAMKNGQAYYNLGIIVEGDRLAVEEVLDGGKVFNLMNKVSGKVGAVYNNKTKIYLQITQTNWQQYEMLPSAYLHQGLVELTPSDFKLNDNVDIYLANNKVYEVVKK